ncbi:MAG: methylmalonyl-CoA mutase family protein [Nitrospirae bacterium]|nr:methylmalonyl-CoA mutase family protein [Nitrospirota bacterium]
MARKAARTRTPDRLKRYSTISDLEVPPLYTQADLKKTHPGKDIARPGQFPYTRGIHPTMYRGRLWTMRQFAGFGSPEETNGRFKFLLHNGQMGLSTAFDMPALMGFDCDHPRALGEVGREGVAVSSLRDMEILFDGIPIKDVTTSMTINCTAPIAMAMYLAVAEKQGVPFDRVGGTIQNDMLKEFIAQKEWMVPPGPSLKLCVDIIEFCARHVPRWNPVSISGYHIREAGSTAMQELAFTLYDGITYVEEMLRRKVAVDRFAPRLSFFFNLHSDFFEEIGKLRAARRLWARTMRDRFHAKDPRSLALRMHAQTAGCSLTAQQPLNNVARVALQAMAGVLGGVQSLHANSMDETLALPTEESALVSLRTQQIIAEETGVTNFVDPLGGSYAVESMTGALEHGAVDYFHRLDRMGGMLRAIEQGYPQREIAEASYRYQRQLEAGEKAMVGANKYQMEERLKIPVLKIDPEVEERQRTRLAAVRRERDSRTALQKLTDLKGAAKRNGANLMPHILEAVKAYATLGEISDVLREAYGTYSDPGRF